MDVFNVTNHANFNTPATPDGCGDVPIVRSI
jgi:hypothetical protein